MNEITIRQKGREIFIYTGKDYIEKVEKCSANTIKITLEAKP